MRIVLDTSVLIAGLRSSSGASAAVLEYVLLGEFELCMDLKLALEYRDVAARPVHRAASNLSWLEIERFLARLETNAESVEVLVRHRPLSIDPADDLVLDVAINGEVDAIVSHNLKHMLVPAARFGIEAVTPEALLKMRK